MLSQILSNDELHPVIIGCIVSVIGYVFAAVFTKKTNDGRNAHQHGAGRKYPLAVRVAYGLGITGIMATVVFYGAGIFPQNDWRGLGLGVALMMFLPTLWVVLYWRITGIKLRGLIDEINGESSFNMFVFMYSFLNIIGISAVVSLMYDWLS